MNDSIEQEWQKLLEQIRLLPENEQRAMSLRYEHNYTDIQIMIVLNLSAQGLKQLFRSAYSRLTSEVHARWYL